MRHMLYHLLKIIIAICAILLVAYLPQSSSPLASATNNLPTYDCTTATGIDVNDCEVLVTFYNETDGANWTTNTDWLQTTAPCSWFGISCAEQRVTEINLGEFPSNNLVGSIPSELGQLSSLTQLDLSVNQLDGSIPIELGQLSSLVNLWLYSNQLSGSIPAELGQLSSLLELYLDYNQLSGTIPPDLGELSRLTKLTLNNNRLSSSIPPELGQLSSLTILRLYSNQLSGAIPSELGQLSSLKTLNLSSNQLSGSIPPELGQLSSLNELWLPSNQLSGSIPSELRQLFKLNSLYLHSNQLSGTIPAILVCPPAWPTLDEDELYIDFNRFTAANSQAATCLDERNPTWNLNQTIPPTDLQASLTSPTSVTLSWSPVLFTDTVISGYYEIGLSVDEGASYSVAATSADKSIADITLTSLTPDTAYTIAVRTFTAIHQGARLDTTLDDQTNGLTSDWSESIRIVLSDSATETPTSTPIPPTSTPGSSTTTPAPPINTPVTPSPPQETEFEDNDSCADANPVLPNGAIQVHTFHDQGDTDWVSFDAEAGTTYRIEIASNIDSLADVNLELYTDCEQAPDQQEAPSFNPGVRLDFESPQGGPVYLRLKNFDVNLFGTDAAYTLSVRELIESDSNKALIILAGRLRGADRLQTNINEVSTSVYNLFQRNGYTDDNIYFLATDSTLPGYDVDATKDAMRLAITDWAPRHLSANGSLTLYLMDHGSPNLFYIDEASGQRMSPTDLNGWLDQLESAVPALKTNVFIEACQSGSFIDPEGGTISKPGRIIVTSTNAVNDAKASPGGAYFSDHFLTGLHLGETLATSFERGRTVAKSQYALQESWLDADGNGIPNEFSDAALSASRSFADVGTLASNQWPPHIFDVTLSGAIENFRGTIQADVRDDLKVAQVYAVVYPPDYVTEENIQELQAETLPNFNLTPTGADNTYAGIYPGFTLPGTYRILVYAVDSGGLVATPQEIEVVVGGNDDGKLFLPLVVG